MGGDSGVSDGGGGDLRDEFPEHAGAHLALRLFWRAEFYHGGLCEFVGEFQEIGVVVTAEDPSLRQLLQVYLIPMELPQAAIF